MIGTYAKPMFEMRRMAEELERHYVYFANTDPAAVQAIAQACAALRGSAAQLRSAAAKKAAGLPPLRSNYDQLADLAEAYRKTPNGGPSLRLNKEGQVGDGFRVVAKFADLMEAKAALKAAGFGRGVGGWRLMNFRK